MRITQARGPTIKFIGERIAETDFDTHQGLMRLEVYETEGGAYIAVSELEHADTGNLERRATVIESDPDKQAMQRAVMDAFDWNDRARTMMSEAGWDLAWRVA